MSDAPKPEATPASPVPAPAPTPDKIVPVVPTAPVEKKDASKPAEVDHLALINKALDEREAKSAAAKKKAEQEAGDSPEAAALRVILEQQVSQLPESTRNFVEEFAGDSPVQQARLIAGLQKHGLTGEKAATGPGTDNKSAAPAASAPPPKAVLDLGGGTAKKQPPQDWESAARRAVQAARTQGLQ